MKIRWSEYVALLEGTHPNIETIKAAQREHDASPGDASPELLPRGVPGQRPPNDVAPEGTNSGDGGAEQ